MKHGWCWEQSAGNSKFAGTIEKAQKSLQGAEQQLELLAGTRTRAIVRQLREVERLQPEELRK